MTVIVPTHARAESLAATLESIAEDTFPDSLHEIIVVENGSSVAAGTVEHFQDRLPLVYLRLIEPHKSKALNAALEHATGDLILFFDDDVIVTPGTLRGYADGARRHGRDRLFGGTVRPRWNGAPDFSYEFAFPWSMQEPPEPDEDEAGADIVVLGANWAAWKDDLAEAGGFDTRLGPGTSATGEETEIRRRLVARGIVPVRLRGCSVEHIADVSQTSRTQLLQRWYRNGVAAGFIEYSTSLALIEFTIKRFTWEIATFLKAMWTRGLAFAWIQAGFHLAYVRGVFRGATLAREPLHKSGGSG